MFHEITLFHLITFVLCLPFVWVASWIISGGYGTALYFRRSNYLYEMERRLRAIQSGRLEPSNDEELAVSQMNRYELLSRIIAEYKKFAVIRFVEVKKRGRTITVKEGDGPYLRLESLILERREYASSKGYSTIDGPGGDTVVLYGTEKEREEQFEQVVKKAPPTTVTSKIEKYVNVVDLEPIIGSGSEEEAQGTKAPPETNP